MNKKDKATQYYAAPVAANPETVFFLSQSEEKRKRLPFAPPVITDADRIAAQELEKPSRPANVARIKREP